MAPKLIKITICIILAALGCGPGRPLISSPLAILARSLLCKSKACFFSSASRPRVEFLRLCSFLKVCFLTVFVCNRRDTKGQTILEWIYEVIVSPKVHRAEILTNICLYFGRNDEFINSNQLTFSYVVFLKFWF